MDRPRAGLSGPRTNRHGQEAPEGLYVRDRPDLPWSPRRRSRSPSGETRSFDLELILSGRAWRREEAAAPALPRAAQPRCAKHRPRGGAAWRREEAADRAPQRAAQPRCARRRPKRAAAWRREEAVARALARAAQPRSRCARHRPRRAAAWRRGGMTSEIARKRRTAMPSARASSPLSRGGSRAYACAPRVPSRSR